MPYHEWGDKDFDFGKLYAAEHYMYKWIYRLSGARLITKEKYGTIRYEYLLPYGSHLFYGHCRFPKFQMRITSSWIYDPYARYCKFIAKKVILKAARKYHEVAEEILHDADWLLE